MKQVRMFKNERRVFVALSLLFAFTMSMKAQSIDVKGTVIDKKTGETIIGATVEQKGTTHATVTDMDGNFTLKADANSTVEVRYIGYAAYALKVKNGGSYRIELQEDSQALSEVVVVGYGTQKKVNLTGAVSAVKVDEKIASRTITNVSSALSGLIPGLAVQQNSGMAGGSNATLLVRGMGTVNNANPLIVVDGMPDVDINRIDMNDIESISVLKDASSSAIYGSRAANGVILITTKTGKGAEKLNINYTGSFAFSSPVKEYDPMLDYAKDLTMEQRASRAGRTSSVFMDGTIDQWMSQSLVDAANYPNTNQWDWVTRQAHIETHNVSASGASDKHNFYVSIGTQDETGYMINNDNKRYNFRVNLDYNIRKNIKIGTRIDGQWTNMAYAYDNGFVSYTNSNISPTYAIAGIQPYNFEANQYGGAMAYGEATNATNLYAEYTAHHSEKERQEFNGTVYGEWELIKGLTARVDYSLRYYNQYLKTYSNPIGLNLYNFQTGNPVMMLIPESDPIKDASNQGHKTLLNATLRYEKTFAEHHNVSALFGYTEEYWYDHAFGASRYDRINPNLTVINAALTKTQTTGGNASAEGLRSFLGRFNYSLYDRYLFEFNFRVDGSSKFLPGHQYGFFPSGSVGWRFTEEKFFEPLKKYIYSGKLRLSYGALGNNSGVGRYEQRQTLAKVVYAYNGNNLANGFAANKMINPDFTWEKTKIANIGLDLGFFNNQLTAEIDLYDRLTTGMIRPSSLSTILSGYSAPRVNIGNLRNRGVELNLKWQSAIGKFNYGANFNFSYNRDKLEKWNEELKPGNVYLDMPYGYNYTMVASGIAQTWEDIYNAPVQNNSNLAPGDVLYKDLNGDGQINEFDKKADPNINEQRPTGNYGLTLYGEWHGVDISMLFQGVTGRKDYWMNTLNNVNPDKDRYAFQTLHWNDTWNLDNRNSKLPRLTNGNTAKNEDQSTFWLESRDFLRMKNLQVGYNIPKQWLSKIGVDQLRVYFSAENLFTLTGWDGMDPEKAKVSYASEDPYPIMRTLSFGVNVGI